MIFELIKVDVISDGRIQIIGRVLQAIVPKCRVRGPIHQEQLSIHGRLGIKGLERDIAAASHTKTSKGIARARFHKRQDIGCTVTRDQQRLHHLDALNEIQVYLGECILVLNAAIAELRRKREIHVNRARIANAEIPLTRGQKRDESVVMVGIL